MSGMVQSEDMSSKMHSINGRIYGNLNGLEMHLGDNIRWFVAGLGSQVMPDPIVRDCSGLQHVIKRWQPVIAYFCCGLW